MAKNESTTPPYFSIFKLIWKQCLNVFLVFFVTLSTFPVVQSEIDPVNPEYFGSFNNTKTYFVPVCCFLLFNTFAMLGNIIPNFFIFPGPKYLWIAVVARFAFIPFFIFSNYAPNHRTLPVLFNSDTLYIFVSSLFGLSSGYYSSLAMMYVPRAITDKRYAGIAGMMASASLVTGILFGVNFSYILVWLFKN